MDPKETQDPKTYLLRFDVFDRRFWLRSLRKRKKKTHTKQTKKKKYRSLYTTNQTDNNCRIHNIDRNDKSSYMLYVSECSYATI